MEASNFRFGQNPNLINFDIPGDPPQIITPLTPLPAIASPVIMNSFGPKEVTIDGTAAAAGNGLIINANGSGSAIESMIIRNWTENGILIGDDGPAHENFLFKNCLSNNMANGIAVKGGTLNEFCQNQVVNNGQLGIDLGLDGVTDNDSGDGDPGPNDLQNFPVLSLARSELGTGTLLVGHLNSVPNKLFAIEFFANDMLDPTQHGEGQEYIGRTFVTTDNTGHADIEVLLGAATSTDRFITSTATHGDLINAITSEFSRPTVVQVMDGIPIDLVLTGPNGFSVELTNPPVLFTNCYEISNAGLVTANGVVFRMQAENSIISVSSSQGSCTTSGQTVNCSLGVLAPGSTGTVKVVHSVSTEGTYNNFAAIDSSLNPKEDDLSNNIHSQVVTATSPQASDLSASFSALSQSLVGETIVKTITISNLSSEVATGVKVFDILPYASELVSSSSPFGPGTVSTPNESFVSQVIQDILCRPASPAEISLLGAFLDTSTVSRAQFVNNIMNGPDFQLKVIDEVYREHLFRPPDSGEIGDAQGEFLSGDTTIDLRKKVLSTNDKLVLTGGGDPALYINIVASELLGRLPSEAESDAWFLLLGDPSVQSNREAMVCAVVEGIGYCPKIAQTTISRFLHIPPEHVITSEIALWIELTAILTTNRVEEALFAFVAASDTYFNFAGEVLTIENPNMPGNSEFQIVLEVVYGVPGSNKNKLNVISNDLDFNPDNNEFSAGTDVGLPQACITVSNNMLTIKWPVEAPIQMDQVYRSITIPIAPGGRYYRLHYNP